MILYGWPELVASVGGEKRKDTILSNMFVGVLRVDEGFDGFVDEELDGFVDEELDEESGIGINKSKWSEPLPD